ncbi:hypothetical protein DIPPA_25733 [Diplonema papillatum]|nr:hypothetical protein DIPPA_25733 [Diplonema papillatum]
MTGPGLTSRQKKLVQERLPEQRGRPFSVAVSTASVQKYLCTAASQLKVPREGLKSANRALEKIRLRRKECPGHAPPMTFSQWGRLRDRLLAKGNVELVAAGALTWTGALRMADLRAINVTTDVILPQENTVVIRWYTSKEVKISGDPTERSYFLLRG